MIDVNGTLFFSGAFQLWKSDGTDSGTVLIKEVPSGINNVIAGITNLNGTLLFIANDGGGQGLELWKSDGTPTGTVIVKDINPGPGSGGPFPLTVVNDTLYFWADDGVHGSELWKSDGTEAGTVLVKDIVPGPVGSRYSASIIDWIGVNGTLFFTVDDGVNGVELWKSDGTTAGTVLVKDINAGIDSSFPLRLTNVNGTLFFGAGDGLSGFELWKSDGTDAGTVMVKDIRPGCCDIGGSPFGSFPTDLTLVNNTLFFVANNGTDGRQLWKSDGTDTGTVMIKEINLAGGLSNDPLQTAIVSNVLFFQANDGVNGTELWQTDGTPAGTVMVENLNPLGSAAPTGISEFQGDLYFAADDGTTGRELWKLSLSEPNNDVVMSLPGTGVKVLLNDNSSSVTLDSDAGDRISIGDFDDSGEDDVIVRFPLGTGPTNSGGAWISENQGALTLLNPNPPAQVLVGNFDGVAGDDRFLVSAGGLSLVLNGVLPPIPITALQPVTMAAGDVDGNGQDDVVLSFASAGTIVLRNLSVVDVLDSTPAGVLELGDIDGNGEDDIFASFAPGNGPGGTGGLSFSVNQGALTSLTTLETLKMTRGDFDGSGQDDFLLDFGGATGLVLLLNGVSAVPLGVLPVVAMASGDVDSSGQDDMFLSITGTGTIAFKNLTTVEVLDPGVALDLATGNIDGN